MSAATTEVHNPVSVEQKIEDTANRIAKGVAVVTAAEPEGPVHERRYAADIESMPHREAADIAEIAFKHAERTAKALEKELFAWQSINSNIRAMYGAAGTGQR